MKLRKKVTPAKAAANKTNAKNSPGPTSIRGKKHAKMNAMIHGFFARELVPNEEETGQFETLRRNLQPQLSPTTVLQYIGFGEIMACIGRCKLALRLEMHRVSRFFAQDDAQQAQPDQPGGAGGRAEWYMSGRQGLREGMRLLEDVKQEFLSLGRIDQRWNVALDEAFGPRLRQLLTEWMPPNKSAAQLAHHLITHAETFRRPLPTLEQEQGPGAEGENTPKVILDPEQSKQMVIKLLELESSMLYDLLKSAEQRASDSARTQNDTVDFAPRYFSTACRDLHRAIDRYLELKKNNL